MLTFTKTGNRQHLNQHGQPVTLCELPFSPVPGGLTLLHRSEPVYDHRDGFDPRPGKLPACQTCADVADRLQNG